MVQIRVGHAQIGSQRNQAAPQWQDKPDDQQEPGCPARALAAWGARCAGLRWGSSHRLGKVGGVRRRGPTGNSPMAAQTNHTAKDPRAKSTERRLANGFEMSGSIL